MIKILDNLKNDKDIGIKKQAQKSLDSIHRITPH